MLVNKYRIFSKIFHQAIGSEIPTLKTCMIKGKGCYNANQIHPTSFDWFVGMDFILADNLD
jgi:hypothetical protein